MRISHKFQELLVSLSFSDLVAVGYVEDGLAQFGWEGEKCRLRLRLLWWRFLGWCRHGGGMMGLPARGRVMVGT